MNAPISTFNGINGATGSYLLPPMTPRELAAIAKGETLDEGLLQDLTARARLTSKRRSLKEGVDPKDLSQSGWGVIFAHEDKEKLPGIKESLGRLLALRKGQAGIRYREFIAVDAYRPDESKTDFLARHGAGPGPVDPTRVPYYLLIVGGPESIPFSFQYQLDVQYAVGRLHFDTLDEYARYAENVIRAETTPVGTNEDVVFFGVDNPDDPATQLSAAHLVQPLAEKIAPEVAAAGRPIRTLLGPEATKTNLAKLLGGDETPALLFSASHGMGFPPADPRQLPHQGALLCQDWPGPAAWKGPIPGDHYFSADDLETGTGPQGLLAFLFACYGAGTPRMDDFAHQTFRAPTAISPHPFIARLPQRLLSQPGGGALAVIGHVERAWGYSFLWDQAGSQLAVFESTLKRLLSGHPIGSAMEYFNQRYAELSTVLSEELRGIQFGKIVDDLALAGMWTANNDARSYVVLGDPAVRLPAAGNGSAPSETPVGARINIADKINSSGSPPASETIFSPEASGRASDIETEEPFINPLAAAHDRLAAGMAELAVQLSESLERMGDPEKPLVISTYTTLDEEGGESEAIQQLRARTRIDLAGDIDLALPGSPGELEEAIWGKHLDLVKLAGTHRAEMLQSIASAAASLLRAIDPH